MPPFQDEGPEKRQRALEQIPLTTLDTRDQGKVERTWAIGGLGSIYSILQLKLFQLRLTVSNCSTEDSSLL